MGPLNGDGAPSGRAYPDDAAPPPTHPQLTHAPPSPATPLPLPQMGPLVSADQLATVTRYMSQGKQEGACVVAGGGRVGDKGYFVQVGLHCPRCPALPLHSVYACGRPQLAERAGSHSNARAGRRHRAMQGPWSCRVRREEGMGPLPAPPSHTLCCPALT